MNVCLSVAGVALSTILIPFFTALFAYFIQGEDISLSDLFGRLLIIFGLITVVLIPGKRKAKAISILTSNSGNEEYEDIPLHVKEYYTDEKEYYDNWQGVAPEALSEHTHDSEHESLTHRSQEYGNYVSVIDDDGDMDHIVS